ncbi:hypothetical protein HNQ51_002170 [Inhella inkyongensis]|uniref:EF-hand domain-containing protein n=1 Tax=Inhella inkyongensis TaxID=392593 RepID=A0A840S774_9BURK|nr:HupE/UreJ family protein [Inhella inkyongensis]MBB5204856.1 hypothetical protein [Inhella inkyongensis]
MSLRGLFCVCLALGLWAPAQAHLMAAQRGTLNLVGSGGFVVMAIAVDALRRVDDDGDGRLSAAELGRHAPAIEAQVRQGLQLLDAQGPRPLQALMLTLSPDDRSPQAPAAELVVMGRFALPDAADGPLRLAFTLFGPQASGLEQRITVTRGSQRQVLLFAPGRAPQAVLPSAQTVLIEQAVEGARHILVGPDHLLFLALMLASASSAGWRRLAATLTAFTAGHALTLALCVLAGVRASSVWVEPAIALTLIGLAGLDLQGRRRGRSLSLPLHGGLVFACALVHGLALGNAFQVGGGPEGDSGGLLWVALLGFNLGIEATQLLIAFGLLGLAHALRRVVPLARQPRLASALKQGGWVLSLLSLGLGGLWLVQRL